jgi:hypothetical protein
MFEELKAHALTIAQTQLGVRETSRNSGPEVDAYLFAVGLDPGQAWCAAFVVWCYMRAASELRIRSMPLPRTGKVTRLWHMSANRFGRDWPSVGDIYCHATDLKILDSPGHCGIVVRVHPDGSITGIEGNTNEAGSHDGVCVGPNRRAPAYVNLGFIDVTRDDTVKILRPVA